MMGLSTSLICIMLFCQTFGTVVCSKDNCTNPITKKLVVGYYCPADARTAQFANAPLHLCTHYCVSEFRCSMLSYYVNKRLCLVHNEICMEMVKDTADVQFNYAVCATETRMYLVAAFSRKHSGWSTFFAHEWRKPYGNDISLQRRNTPWKICAGQI